MKRKLWSREDSIILLEYYCRTTFGMFHHHNDDIIAYGKRFGRTADAVAMKLCNFAHCDPNLSQKGLAGASKQDHELFALLLEDPFALFSEVPGLGEKADESTPVSEIPKARNVETKATSRRGHNFFRKAVHSNFDHCCALTNLSEPQLLVASHIVGWNEDLRLGTLPQNGLLLNSLHDAAFDRGLIAFDDDLRLLVSDELLEFGDDDPYAQENFGNYQHRQLRMPRKFSISLDFIRRHREQSHCR